MDELEFAAQFAPAGAPTLNDIFARALLSDRGELDEARRAREERRLTMAMANRQAGDPIGEVNRCQMAVASCRDEVTDLEARLDAARGRLHRAAEQLIDWQAQADEILAISAQRSQTPDLLSEAKRVAAEVRVDAMLALRSAGAPRRERRPFGGEVSRSHLECVYCLRENVDAETSALLHHDPTWNVPVTTHAQAEQADQATAERRTRNAGRVITR